MKETNDIHDDQIRVLGQEPDEAQPLTSTKSKEQRGKRKEECIASEAHNPSAMANCHGQQPSRDEVPIHRGTWRLLAQFLGWAILVFLLSLLLFRTGGNSDVKDPDSYSQQPSAIAGAAPNHQPSQDAVASTLQPLNPSTPLPNRAQSQPGFTEILDQRVGEIPLRLYIPHHAELTLHIGPLDREDRTIIYAACAADIRADNGGIVGAFVLRGEPRAWGLSKKGYCASIGGKVSIGVADNSPLFEQATHEAGYFFRQYPLVSDGRIVENRPLGSSIRRALCDRGGEILMVESLQPLTFHDFAQTLVHLGVDQAIYLMGSTAYGWAIDAAGDLHEFGEDHYYSGQQPMPENINYIVWKKRSE